jgi:hypothetical protein
MVLTFSSRWAYSFPFWMAMAVCSRRVITFLKICMKAERSSYIYDSFLILFSCINKEFIIYFLSVKSNINYYNQAATSWWSHLTIAMRAVRDGAHWLINTAD